MSTTDWAILVHTGFNDIDRRCDNYLVWLEDGRARGPYVTSTLNRTNTLIESILNIAAPCSATVMKAINYVSSAFGFAEESFTSYQSLILSGLEESTINSTVLQNRLEFRQTAAKLHIRYKPDAVHLLSSYLRICMPHTIKNNINVNAQTIVTGSFAPPSYTVPVLSIPSTLISAEPFKGETKVNVRPSRNPRKIAPGWEVVKSAVSIDLATAMAIQRALCFGGSAADGKYGPKTMAGLRLFEVVFTGQQDNANWRSVPINLGKQKINALRNMSSKSCSRNAQNFLERSLTEQNFHDITIALKTKYGSNTEVNNFGDLRELIKIYRSEMGYQNDPNAFFADQYTPEMFNDLGLGFDSD